jgi:uncharacterized membrane protein
MTQAEFLEKIDQPRIVSAIAAAEKQTSGEMRVHVQPKVYGEIRTVAEKTFERLGMSKTALRNGVLLFIASEEQRFVILGDRGIHDKVPAGFWDDIAGKLAVRFRSGEFTDGIVEAIGTAGQHLKAYFPRAEDDIDELSNEIDIES